MRIRLMKVAVVFPLLAGTACAQANGDGGALPSSVLTQSGSGLASGPAGSRSVIVPGSAVPGLLMNNGNGTSSLMIPGAPSQLVPTPR